VEHFTESLKQDHGRWRASELAVQSLAEAGIKMGKLSYANSVKYAADQALQGDPHLAGELVSQRLDFLIASVTRQGNSSLLALLGRPELEGVSFSHNEPIDYYHPFDPVTKLPTSPAMGIDPRLKDLTARVGISSAQPDNSAKILKSLNILRADPGMPNISDGLIKMIQDTPLLRSDSSILATFLVAAGAKSGLAMRAATSLMYEIGPHTYLDNSNYSTGGYSELLNIGPDSYDRMVTVDSGVISDANVLLHLKDMAAMYCMASWTGEHPIRKVTMTVSDDALRIISRNMAPRKKLKDLLDSRLNLLPAAHSGNQK
jgi:hypothetical protein